MYNEEQKNRFIKECPYAVKYFEKAEPYEERFGKDLYDFNTPQILEFYKMLFSTSLDVLINFNTTFERYATFALKNSLIADGQNHFAEINRNMLMHCIDKRSFELTSRTELKHITDKLLNPLEKYLFWALFEGIKGYNYCEITELKWKDIDTKNKTAILCTGRTVNLSDELIMYARESYETDIYFTYPTTSDKTSKKKHMIGNIWKVPDIKNVADDIDSKGTQCYRLITRCVKYLGMPVGYFSGKHLADSGLMDYIKSLAIKYGVSNWDIIYDHMHELEKQYEFTAQKRVNYVRKYKSYLEQ